MADTWRLGEAGVMLLPSGRLIRGRGMRYSLPPGPRPTFGLYLLGRLPPAFEWESRWIRWRDFWLPSDREDTIAALREALDRATTQPSVNGRTTEVAVR